MALDLEGVAVSTGAACAAGAVEPSHVLRAMGFAPERVQSSLRLSLGRSTTGGRRRARGRRDRGRPGEAQKARSAGACSRDLLLGVVRGADERARLDVGVAERQGELAQRVELRGRVVAADRQVLRRGPQVLADREDVGPGAADGPHRLLELGPLLAEADHHAALGEQPRVLRAAQQLERAREARARARLPVEARHGLDVVVEDVGTGVDARPAARPSAP